MYKTTRFLANLILFLPIIYLVLFFFYPLLIIFRESLVVEGEWQAAGLTALVNRPYLREVIFFTFWQAALSTALTMVAGLPAAYAFARFRFRGKALLRAVLTVPFVLPTVVVAVAFLALLGPRGLLASAPLPFAPEALQSPLFLIFLAHVFYNLSIVVRLVGGFWSTLDPRLEEAAAMLGAEPRRVFWSVTAPLLRPVLGAAALLIFLFTFSSFGVVLILGGSRYNTIEVEIYRQALSFFNLPLAATLSLLQMGFNLLLMWAYARLQARSSVTLELRSEQSVQRTPSAVGEWLFLLGAVGLPVIFVLAPLVALVERSLLVEGGRSLGNYIALSSTPASRSLFDVAPQRAIVNSLLFALATTGLSLLLGLLSAFFLAPPTLRPRSAWRALLDPLFLLPLGSSAVTLGFGFILALDTPPLNLRTSVLLIPLAHSLIAFPFVVRSVLPVLRGIDPTLREAAAILGAAPLRRLRELEAPLVARPLLVGATFAFAISMGEFGATSLVQRPEWPTLPLMIFRFLGQPGALNYGQALALSVILTAVTIVGFLLIERARVGELGEF